MNKRENLPKFDDEGDWNYNDLSSERLFAPRSWHPCSKPRLMYGINLNTEPRSIIKPLTPCTTFTLSSSLEQKTIVTDSYVHITLLKFPILYKKYLWKYRWLAEPLASFLFMASRLPIPRYFFTLMPSSNEQYSPGASEVPANNDPIMTTQRVLN